MSNIPQEEQQQNNKEQSDNSNIYLTENSTLQTPEEAALDKNKDNRQAEDQIETNTIEDVDVDRLAGSDRAGTNERKP
jgi:hypothetical protein